MDQTQKIDEDAQKKKIRKVWSIEMTLQALIPEETHKRAEPEILLQAQTEALEYLGKAGKESLSRVKESLSKSSTMTDVHLSWFLNTSAWGRQDLNA